MSNFYLIFLQQFVLGYYFNGIIFEILSLLLLYNSNRILTYIARGKEHDAYQVTNRYLAILSIIAASLTSSPYLGELIL